MPRKMMEPTFETCRVSGRKPEKDYIGFIEKCFDGDKTYAAFYNIPYGKPPKGMKRYQAPEPLNSIEPSSNVQESDPTRSMSLPAQKADVKRKACIQPPNFEGSADCLYLNIFLPEDPDRIEKLLPVLVFIHGGGFLSGSNDPEKTSPEDIVQHGLVFVMMNYRLGAYGFLNLHTTEVPGNAGLKDQVLALEWIRDNIQCFKGDPENVTISGWSAGASCVNLHLVSPLSKDLFHKAIIQSGGIFSLWGYKGHGLSQKNLFLGDPEFRSLLFDEKKEKELHIHARALIKNDCKAQHSASLSPIYGPTREKEKEGAFIPDDIEKLMEKVQLKIPILAGITKNEAVEVFCRYRAVNLEVAYREVLIDDQKFCQILMDSFRWSKDTATRRCDEIRKKYFTNISKLSDDEMYRRIADFFHDTMVRCFYDCFKFGPEKTVHKDLYVYQFDHFSEISAAKVSNLSHFKDATHGDDKRYLYSSTLVKKLFQEKIYEGASQNREIRQVMNHMWSLWANFCRTGTPKSDFDSSIGWKRHSEDKPYYLNISNNLVLKKGSPLSDKCDWLNKLVNSETPMQS